MSLTLVSSPYSLTLPNPELNDMEHIENSPVINRSMSGDIYVYNLRVNQRKLVYSFILTNTQKNNLDTFINNVKGSLITLTDFNSVTWVVKLVSGPLSFEEFDCKETSSSLWRVTLEFEGDRS